MTQAAPLGRASAGGERSRERLLHHFTVERELADRLRRAGAEQRRTLYTEVYDELFRRVQDHPQLTAKAEPAARARSVGRQAALLKRLLPKGGVLVEVGPGDCALSFALCAHAGRVVGVDVSHEVTRSGVAPANFQLVISDGSRLPLPDASADLVYSDQLMEHLHPEDAERQLAEVHRVLKTGGRYLCITPNRLSGPHDVTRFFDEPEAKGLHLKEYSLLELDALFAGIGFQHRRALIGTGGRFVSLPVGVALGLEAVVAAVPSRFRRRLKRAPPIRRALNVLLGVRMIGTKA